MIVVSDTITLTAITINDQEKLFELMSRIYLPEYRHLWFDDGSWYMEKYIPTPIWNEISPFTTHPIILFSINRKQLGF
jgi:hypothetical protein